MVIGTLLAVAALVSQVPSASDLWDTVQDPVWAWLLVAVLCAVGNKAGYALALMGSTSLVPPFRRSFEAMFAAAFSNLALPGIGGTAVQVRFLQLQGADLAAAVAAGAVLANVANVVVQGALFFVTLLLGVPTVDTGALELDEALSVLRTIIFGAACCVAVAFGVPRFRRRVLPPTRRGIDTIRSSLHSPRQVVLLVVGNLMAALMSALCLFTSVKAYGGSVEFRALLVANIVVGTVASLIPVPGGNTVTSAIGLSSALLAFGVPETAAAAAVLMQQLISTYLLALPGWFATNHMLRRGLL